MMRFGSKEYKMHSHTKMDVFYLLLVISLLFAAICSAGVHPPSSTPDGTAANKCCTVQDALKKG